MGEGMMAVCSGADKPSRTELWEKGAWPLQDLHLRSLLSQTSR